MKIGAIGESGASIAPSYDAHWMNGAEDVVIGSYDLVLPAYLLAYEITTIPESSLVVPVMEIATLSRSDGGVFHDLRDFFEEQTGHPDLWLQFDGLSASS